MSIRPSVRKKWYEVNINFSASFQYKWMKCLVKILFTKEHTLSNSIVLSIIPEKTLCTLAKNLVKKINSNPAGPYPNSCGANITLT